VPFHQEVLQDAAFVEGRVTTRWVEQSFLPDRKARLRAAADAAKAAGVVVA
jgi:acetyl-CoA carboxylase, biotin carboxylase subunit